MRRLASSLHSSALLYRTATCCVATTTLLGYLSYLYSAALAHRMRHHKPFKFFPCGFLWRSSEGRPQHRPTLCSQCVGILRLSGCLFDTVSQKKCQPFYICDNLFRRHPILPILGRNMPWEIRNKHIYPARHKVQLANAVTHSVGWRGVLC